MRQVVIVGAGIAGSSLASAMRARGADVTVVAADHGGSAAALGLVRPSYLAREQRGDMAQSLGEFHRNGVPVMRGAAFSSYQGTARPDKDWWAVSPLAPLLTPDIGGVAEPLSEGAVTVDGKTLRAGLVVWCDGGGPGKVTYGSTWVHPDPQAVVPDFAVHLIAPYKTVAATRLAGEARIGSSSATTFAASVKQAEGLFAAAVERGWVALLDGWARIDGKRLDRDQHLVAHESGAWRWSGFHRSGYSLAPAEAERVADRLLR